MALVPAVAPALAKLCRCHLPSGQPQLAECSTLVDACSSDACAGIGYACAEAFGQHGCKVCSSETALKCARESIPDHTDFGTALRLF